MTRRHPDAQRVILRAERGFGEQLVADALVSTLAFSPRYDLDREAGTFSRPGHPLEGVAMAGKALVFPAVQGGVAGGWVFHELRSRGLAPAALIFGRTNPVMVQGAVLAGIPVLDGFSSAALAQVRTGMRLRIDPVRLELELLPPRASYAPMSERV